MFSVVGARLLGAGLLMFGAIISDPARGETDQQEKSAAAAILARELLKMDSETEITVLSDKMARLRGFHALERLSGDDIWELFVWIEDDCTIRASSEMSWSVAADRRLEVRLDRLRSDEIHYGHGGTSTLLGNGREAPVCLQIPAKPPKCRTVATNTFCRTATPADMFCLQNLRIDNPFGNEDSLDGVVRAISQLQKGCLARRPDAAAIVPQTSRSDM
jgi:hypothetical protein